MVPNRGTRPDGSENREPGSEMGKMAYGHEMKPAATERWSTKPLPPFSDLPDDKTEVPAKNERKPMQNECSGAKTRSSGSRKPAVKHRKWCLATKWVSKTPVSLERE